MNIPVIYFDQQKAHAAFDDHARLLRIESRHPELADDPEWTIAKQDAYTRFREAFAA